MKHSLVYSTLYYCLVVFVSIYVIDSSSRGSILVESRVCQFENYTYYVNEYEDFAPLVGCTEFLGELIIGGLLGDDEHLDSDITHVDPLESLELVGGLRLRECYLENVDGLRNLREVDGPLVLEILPFLQNIDGFHNLQVVTDNTYVIECDILPNLDGFVHVIRFGGEVIIDENDEIRNVDGLWEFTTVIEDNIYLDNNPKLCHIDQVTWEQRFHVEVHVEHNANATYCRQHPRIPPFVPDFPNITAITSRSIRVQFFKANNTHGLIRQYRFFPYDVDAGVELPGRNFTDPSPFYKVLTFDITDLHPDRRYQIRMSVVSLVGERSANRSQVIYRTLEDIPEGPTNITAFPYDKEVQLSWGIPKQTNGNITQYIVYLYAKSKIPWHLVYIGKELSHTVTDLIPDTDYSLILSSCTAIGCINTTSLFTSAIVPPEQISKITITRTNAITVKFIWTNCFVANDRYGITNYRIYANNMLILTDTQATEHDIDIFSPGITYDIYIAAFNRGGMGKSDITELTMPPAPPAGLRLPSVTIGDKSVVLTWFAPVALNGNMEYYLVYIEGESLPRCNTTKDHKECVIKGLDANSSYKVKVMAFNNAGNCSSDWKPFTTTRGGLLNSGISTEVVALSVVGSFLAVVFAVVGLIAYKRYRYRKMKAYYTTTNLKMNKFKASKKGRSTANGRSHNGNGGNDYDDEDGDDYDEEEGQSNKKRKKTTKQSNGSKNARKFFNRLRGNGHRNGNGHSIDNDNNDNNNDDENDDDDDDDDEEEVIFETKSKKQKKPQVTKNGKGKLVSNGNNNNKNNNSKSSNDRNNDNDNDENDSERGTRNQKQVQKGSSSSTVVFKKSDILDSDDDNEEEEEEYNNSYNRNNRRKLNNKTRGEKIIQTIKKKVKKVSKSNNNNNNKTNNNQGNGDAYDDDFDDDDDKSLVAFIAPVGRNEDDVV